MKQIYIFLVLILIGAKAIHGQTNKKAEQEFSKMMSSIKTEKSNEKRLQNSIQFFNHRRGTTTRELMEIASYLSNDRLKYRLCLQVYPNIIDKQYFFNVFDIFERFSFAMKLYHNTIAKKRDIIIDSDQDHQYDNIRFPDASRYRGRRGVNCRMPMADRDFDYYISDLRLPRDERQRLRNLKDEVEQNCFSTAQIMKLGLELDLEKNKLSFLKYAYNKTYDLGNFDATIQILNHSFYKDDLLNYIGHQHQDEIVIEEICEVNPEEFNFAKNSLRSQSFRRDKLQLAKRLISKNCYNLQQFEVIFKMFNFEDDRLNLMIYSYEYTSEPRKMYRFRNLLKFRSNQQKYDRFLIDKQ